MSIENLKEKAKEALSHPKRTATQLAVSASVAYMTSPALALAAKEATESANNASNKEMLTSIITLVNGAVGFLGAFLIVWGAVNLGLAIREQSGGPQIASAIATIAGGAVIVAASFYFSSIDTSWIK